ncbi:oligosaccharide flippase family protein [Gordonia sp. 852002-50816_SCH5313054-a]|uniref:oligosaccharide flippase family protein n=2 Tax=Gordonia TaxID=2053 RepID=UPI003FA5D56D
MSRSASLLVLGRLISTALALVTAPIVARALGPDGRGETAAVIALSVILPVLFSIGMPIEVRRISALGQGEAALRTARVWCVLAIPICVGAAALLRASLFRDFDRAAQITAFVAVCCVPISILWTLDVSYLVALEKYRSVLAVLLSQPCTYLVSVIVALSLVSLTPAAVIVCSVAGTVVAGAVSFTLTRVSIRGAYARPVPMLRNSIRYAGSAVAEAAGNRVDQVVGLPVLGATEAGFYSVAATVASVPIAFGQAVGARHFPKVARAKIAGNILAARATAARRAVATSASVLLPAILAVFVGIPVIFGSEYSGAVIPAIVCTIGSSAMIVSYVLSLTLAAEGRGIRMAVTQAIALCVGMIGLLLLGPKFGAVGAAVASALSSLALLIILVAVSGLSFRDLRPRLSDFRHAFADMLSKGE